MKINGFTLIELMIVVAIIGILASIALPSYQTYTTRAQVVEALTLAEEIKGAIKEYYKYKGEFPADNASAGVPMPQYLIGNYVKGITVENGAMHVKLGNKVSAAVKGKVLSLRPLVVTGSPQSPISWNCGYSDAPEGMEAVGDNETTVDSMFLPAMCRGI